MSSRQYLIADPDEGQRQLLDLLLADGTSTMVAVGTARQALEYLRSNTPSLVVLAQELPDMPGTAVSKRLKAVQRLGNVPVIVTTDPPEGLGVSLDLRQEAERAGVDLLLPKPLGDKAIKERARRLMQDAELAQSDAAGASKPRRQGSTAVIEQTLKELDEAAPGAEGAGNEGDTSSTSVSDTHGGVSGTGGGGTRAGAGAPGSRSRSHKAHSDAEVLTKEVERLREESVKLKRRLLAAHETIDKLRAEVDDLKRRRGLFGRRK